MPRTGGLYQAGLLAGAISALMLPCMVTAADYGSSSSSAIQRGLNFDPRDPSRRFPSCVEWDVEVQLETGEKAKPITSGVQFSVGEVTSRRELYETLHKDVKVAGNYGLFRGGASASEDSSYNFEANSLVFVVKAEIDYGSWDLQGLRLNSRGLGLVQSGNLDAFIDTCGTEVIVTRRRGVMAAAVFSVTGMSEERKNKLSAAVSVGASGAGWGADVNATYEKFVREFAENSQIKIEVHGIGGSGPEALGELITKYKDPNEVRKILEKYFVGLTYENSASTQYTSALLGSYTGGMMPSIDMSDYLRYIERIWLAKLDLQSRLNRVNDDISQAEEYPLTSDEIGKLSRQSNEIASRLSALDAKAIACRASFTTVAAKTIRAAATSLSNNCALVGADLIVPAYPIAARAKQPVVFNFDRMLARGDGVPVKVLFITVNGDTLVDAYVRVPAGPGAAPSLEKRDVLVKGRASSTRPFMWMENSRYYGELAWGLGWEAIEVVAVTRSGRKYTELVRGDTGWDGRGLYRFVPSKNSLDTKLRVPSLDKLAPYKRPAN